MSRPKPLTSDAAEEGGLKELYAEIRLSLELPEPPSLLQVMGHSPRSLRGLWGFLKAALVEGEGRVPRTTKEYIALAAASSADAGPLRDWMLKTLSDKGIDQAVLTELVEKGETQRLPEKTRRVLLFARRAALDPARLSDEDFDELVKAGLSDEDIVELVAFAALITSLIATIRALGLRGAPASPSGGA